MPIPKGKRKLVEEIRWRGTGNVSVDEARTIGPELKRLTREATARGEILTPVDIVAAARDESSPLHKRIWGLSDPEAAYRYRVNQAVYVVNHIVEDVISADGQVIQHRPIISLPVEDEDAGITRGYQDRRMVDPTEYNNYRLMQAFTEMRSFLHRHADIPDLDPVVKAMRRVMQLHGEDYLPE